MFPPNRPDPDYEDDESAANQDTAPSDPYGAYSKHAHDDAPDRAFVTRRVGRPDASEAASSRADEELDDLLQTQTPPVRLRSARAGRARERMARRRQEPIDAPYRPVRPSARRADTKPALRLPKIRLNGVLVGAVLAMVFVVGLVAVLGQLLFGAVLSSETPPNAIWIGTEWTYEAPSEEAVKQMVERLQANQIGTVYAWVSWLQGDNTWRGTTNFDNVAAFVRQFKQLYPNARLFGWVSLPVSLETDDYRLDDEAVQIMIADFSARVIEEFGFDGVFLNIEPVWSDDDNFLALLRMVRARVGRDVPISVAIPPDWSPRNVDIPTPPLIVPGTEWAEPYKRSVALLVDELVVMAYNSGLTTPDDYSTWVAYQVQAYASAVDAVGGAIDVVIGIPTYDAEPPGHDPSVESVPAAIRGVRAGLQAAADAAVYVRGLAIYAEWTTDENEWSAFQTNWVAGR